MGTAVQAPRISAEDLKSRLQAGQRATILDVRGAAAWDQSTDKIRGAVRAQTQPLQVDPSWPQSQLTVVY